MKFTYHRGNAVSALLDEDINVLLHITNCQGVMGSGIAKEVKQRIPQAFDAYLTDLRLGSTTQYILNSGMTNFRCVVNINAQEFYGHTGKRYLDYGALSVALNKLSQFNLSDVFGPDKPIKIGLPFHMGACRAGGDWEIILEMLAAHFDQTELHVYVL